MLVHVEIAYMYFKKFNILIQSKERPARTKCTSAKLGAVVVSAESDSAQCLTILDCQKNFGNFSTFRF